MLHKGGDNHVRLNRLREMTRHTWRVYKGDKRIPTCDAVCRSEGVGIMDTIGIFVSKGVQPVFQNERQNILSQNYI
jgi:hypothetical protein